uniref:Uncharacterized protein n=2 Tax=Leptocylindrus aporus TaxID=1398097 RepID=A0A7S0KAE7_9STRA|mmetsp:Transcript_1127/g.1497  ORF Transcript_1127/g.1497 Transcript_1127/m.1497 type:complete len:313 (+) Transcript_1127:141-1079(+)
MQRNQQVGEKVEYTVLNLHDTLLETKEKNIKVDGVPHVEVAAPSNLPEGYVFDVKVGGRIIQATVPLGGVEAGQKFSVPLGEDTILPASQRGNIPVGRWRDGLCECFKHGICHAWCCLNCWCMVLGLGQLLNRMGLDACVREVDGVAAFDPLLVNWCIVVLNVVWSGRIYYLFIVTGKDLSRLISEQLEENPNTAIDKIDPDDICSWNVRWSNNRGEAFDDYCATKQEAEFENFVVFCIMFIYSVCIISKLRAYLRRRYAIPTSFPCEDVVCACCCGQCITCQMGRHTANYDVYSSECCSSTGLSSTHPEIV